MKNKAYYHKSDSTDNWVKYWKDNDIENKMPSTKLRSYQKPVFDFIKHYLKKNKINRILNAGAGEDIISYNLKKMYCNNTDINMLDISTEILRWNKTLFNKDNLSSNYINADIFKIPLQENSYDIVFNTGVLEHFEKNEQIKMAKEIMRILKPSGVFITANPSDSGKIYKLGMNTAKKKGAWPFGKETPVFSLKFFTKEISNISYIKEYHRDFLGQLPFLSYINPLFKLITHPTIILAKLLHAQGLCDLLFSRIFGTYLIISIIKKK